MDFRSTTQEDAFRAEIRAWLDETLPPNWRLTVGNDTDGEEREEYEREFARKAGAKGYLAVGWPKEYGGMGFSPMQQFIFNEEMALAKAPRGFMGPGVYQVGSSLIIHGTEWQKKTFLPPIARGEVRWCSLLSEPNAGSDLASLQTTAVEDGDDFVVNGQKTWTTNGHKAEHGILLARTNRDVPKHKGISYFLVDMKWPGITVQPIINMAEAHSINSVFFDNVRIPRDRLLGEKDQGWYLGQTTLNAERSGVRWHVPLQQLFDEIVEYVVEAGRNGGFDPIEANQELRRKIADTHAQMRISWLLAYRVVWLQSQGEPPSYESSQSKLWVTELTQRVVGLGMEILGLYSQLAPGAKGAVLHGKMQKLYRAQRAITLGAGTSEIQRNIIARRGLGMGR